MSKWEGKAMIPTELLTCLSCTEYEKNKLTYNFEAKLKIINLSMMIGSDIDMEFSEGSEWNIGKLISLNNYVSDIAHHSLSSNNHSKCRVRQNHWHAWTGGECPLPEGLNISLIMRSRRLAETTEYQSQFWMYSGGNSDVIAFKVLGTAINWSY